VTFPRPFTKRLGIDRKRRVWPVGAVSNTTTENLSSFTKLGERWGGEGGRGREGEGGRGREVGRGGEGREEGRREGRGKKGRKGGKLK
jgi:hypothetical protein